MKEKDILQRFLFEYAPVRGEAVRLDATWRQVLERHDYPPAVRGVLGEMMVASVLLSATLKFDGRMTLQIQGDGPINLLVVECWTYQGPEGKRYTLRGLAHGGEDVEPGLLQDMFGTARLAITLEPSEGERRYQGIVELVGERLADALHDYLQRSEQLDTYLWLAADSEHAAGMLLQRLPGDEGTDADAWNRAQRLGDTLREDELLTLPPGEIIYRLFHEEDVRLFESETVAFHCSCTRERVGDMLRSLGMDEVHQVLKEQQDIRVACEFCNQQYVFDAVDAEQLFASDERAPEVPETRH